MFLQRSRFDFNGTSSCQICGITHIVHRCGSKPISLPENVSSFYHSTVLFRIDSFYFYFYFPVSALMRFCITLYNRQNRVYIGNTFIENMKSSSPRVKKPTSRCQTYRLSVSTTSPHIYIIDNYKQKQFWESVLFFDIWNVNR